MWAGIRLPLFLEEREPTLAAVEFDANQVAASNLPGGDEIRQWMHQDTVYRPFQVTGAVLQVRYPRAAGGLSRFR